MKSWKTTITGFVSGATILLAEACDFLGCATNVGLPNAGKRPGSTLPLLLALLLPLGAFAADCPKPQAIFRDNIGGDFTKIVFQWSDPPRCEFFMWGTQAETTNDGWFILQPTHSGTPITYDPNSGIYSIGKFRKVVMIDREKLDTAVDPSSPYTPNVNFAELRLWTQVANLVRGAEALKLPVKPKIKPLPKELLFLLQEN